MFCEKGKSRFEPPANKATQTETEPPGGARARLVGAIAVKFLAEDIGQLLQTALREIEVGRLHPFLWTINSRAAFGTQKRILHINCYDEFLEEFHLVRRTDFGQGVKFSPALRVGLSSRKGSPAGAPRR